MAERPFIIGVTGSIGMGKSTVAEQLGSLGASVCSADATVHALLGENGKAVPGVRALFPQAVAGNAVDRKKLGEIVFTDPEKLKQLEQLLHPLVVAEEEEFIVREGKKGAKFVVLDIPLLFETGGEKRCDLTVVATAPHAIQRERVMQRPGMTEEKFARILRQQMPDEEKRRRADVVIDTGQGKEYSFQQVLRLMENINAT